MKKIKVLAISGSTRKESTNEAILKYISRNYSEKVDITIYNSIDRLPHFNPDLDDENPPAEVVELRKQISDADGVLFCTPEYVFSLPGALKNAIEWNVSTTIFSQKPVAIIVASASGQKAYESLYLVMSTLEASINKEATLLIQGAKGKITMEGEVKDTKTIADISTMMEAFIGSVKEPRSLQKSDN